MHLLKIYEMMNEGFGTLPEVLVFQDLKSHITVRLSKRFNGERFYVQFDIRNPVINDEWKSHFDQEIRWNLNALQERINREYHNND